MMDCDKDEMMGKKLEVGLTKLVVAELESVDFETNQMTVILPPEIVARGFHAGNVRVDLSGVQRTPNV